MSIAERNQYSHSVPLTISYPDWLIFSCENLILLKKKETKSIKTQIFFAEKQQKYAKKVYINLKWYSLLDQVTRDATCSKL